MHSSSLKNNIIFYDVKDNSSKIRLLTQSAHDLFAQRKKLLILVPSIEGVQYVDSLLWKYPNTSFLPHTVLDSFADVKIAISQNPDKNWNQATHLFNLFPLVPEIISDFEQIFEFFDRTSLEKQKISEDKMAYYQKKHKSFEILV